jgi:hypothetical protein
MILGVTGTQRGGSEQQLTTLAVQFVRLRPDVFHHGDCIGVDEQAFNIVLLYAGARRRKVKIIAHPCDLRSKRAFTAGNDLVLPVKRPLKRNWDIAEDIEHLLALPYQLEEPVPRAGGGTWATMRYALQLEKSVTVIWPNGTAQPWTKSKYL